jgi:hypothetical protein
MRTDYSVFRDRLAEACKIRDTTHSKLLASIGLGARSTIKFDVLGVRVLDLHHVCQIADVLDVSVDWLVSRSNVMDVMEMPKFMEPEPLKTKPRLKKAKEE